MNEIICKECGAIYTGEKEPEMCICKSEKFEVLEGGLKSVYVKEATY